MRAYHKQNGITEADRKWYTRNNPGFTATRETVRVRFGNRYGGIVATTYVVFKGEWTPYGMCRDCGDHWIIALWSSYLRIEKGSLKITHDAEDC